MRKLVTIRTIDDIRAIEGADAIVCARIGGWDVVVRRTNSKSATFACILKLTPSSLKQIFVISFL